MNGWPIVGVAGARGVVGSVFCEILADAGLPAECLRPFGHEAGNTVTYRGAEVPVQVLDDAAAKELDVLFLAVDAAQSREIMAGPGSSVPLVVDNSSAFRLADGVPLVVPEANAHAAIDRNGGNLIANPNCTTAAAVVALARSATSQGWNRSTSPPTRRSAAPVARGSTRSRRSVAPSIETRRRKAPSTGGSPTASCRRSTCSTRPAGPARRRSPRRGAQDPGDAIAGRCRHDGAGGGPYRALGCAPLRRSATRRSRPSRRR